MSNTDGGTVSQFAGHDGGGGNRHSSLLHHLSISEPVNVWDLPEIQKYKKSLVRKLFPSTIRLACVSCGLINNDQQKMLFMVEEDSAKHNERLLNYIYPSGDNLDHFQLFINQLEGPYFEAIKDKFQEVKDRLQDEKTARIQQIDAAERYYGIWAAGSAPASQNGIYQTSRLGPALPNSAQAAAAPPGAAPPPAPGAAAPGGAAAGATAGATAGAAAAPPAAGAPAGAAAPPAPPGAAAAGATAGAATAPAAAPGAAAPAAARGGAAAAAPTVAAPAAPGAAAPAAPGATAAAPAARATAAATAGGATGATAPGAAAAGSGENELDSGAQRHGERQDGSSQQPCELVVNNPPPRKEPSLALPPASGDLDGQQRASGTKSYGQQQYSSPLDDPELMSKLRKVIINGRNPNRTILAKFQLQVQGCISHFVGHKHVKRVLPHAYCDGIRKTYPDPHKQAEELVGEWTRKALFHFSAGTLMDMLQATGYEHAFYDSIKDDVA
ncbi:transcriptional regulatory protein AlgP-like [Sycon ciliatum]|uniref:transcriptional regulatory protein AlgP-like n=1 Tax=Sycon ciliatum TaxID=27933 RepID=UPI0031F70FA3